MKSLKIFKLIVAAVSFAVLSIVSSCTDGFDELNVNPNQASPEFVPPTTVLASGFDVIGGILYGERMGIFYAGTYAGYTAPIGLGDYEFRIDINNNMWSTLYRGAANFADAQDIATRNGNTNLAAVALAMKAFTFHHITDMWGDVPYSQTFQLLKEAAIRNPVYDTQEQVYDQLLDDLKTANSMLMNGTGELGEGDLIYGGNATHWRKFINSLRLRVAMRMSNVAETKATAVVTEMLGDPATYPLIESNSENAYIEWPGVSSHTERWFRTVGSLSGNKTSQLRMNHEIISALKDHNDPRLPVYADKNANDEYNGYKMGPGQTTNLLNGGANVSHIGNRFGNDPEGFSPFMNVAEVKFMLAEIYERGMFTGDAQEAYEAGVTLSLQENGIDANAINDFLAETEVAWGSGTTTNLYKIHLQNWVAMFKNSVNAWSNVRRTDVPQITNVSADFSTHDRPPFRLAYPDEEQAVNASFPDDIHARAKDTFYGFQLWWDTRAGVQ